MALTCLEGPLPSHPGPPTQAYLSLLSPGGAILIVDSLPFRFHTDAGGTTTTTTSASSSSSASSPSPVAGNGTRAVAFPVDERFFYLFEMIGQRARLGAWRVCCVYVCMCACVCVVCVCMSTDPSSPPTRAPLPHCPPTHTSHNLCAPHPTPPPPPLSPHPDLDIATLDVDGGVTVVLRRRSTAPALDPDALYESIAGPSPPPTRCAGGM